MDGAWMEQEILEQPEVLRDNSDRYWGELRDEFRGREYEMIVLAARGSSDNAALYGRYLAEVGLAIPVSLAAPSVLTRYGTKVHYPRCLAVGISQSGAAPDVSEVLSRLREDGHDTLAVTNTPGSRITEAASFSLDLGVGEERSVAATKTYTASLLALYQLVRALGADLPDPRNDLPTVQWSAQCRVAADQAAGPVLRSHRWFALGRGYSFSSANETALKMMECALVPCKSYSTADFAHGPRALATHGSMAVVYGEAPAGLEQSGCLVVRAPDAGPGPASPMREIVFGQWLALVTAWSKGLDPDRPDHLQKVTQTL